jgi:hypothetical protein
MASERWRVAVASVALVLCPAVAQAAPTPTAADRETARTLMDVGRKKEALQDFKGALKAYQGADAIMHVPATGLAVAQMQAATGQLVEARDTALAVVRSTPEPREPEIFAQNRKTADEMATALEPRIPSLTIQVKAPADVTPDVLVDGVAVPYAALVAPRRLNPGHHVVVAKIGTVERRAEADLAERESKTVQVEFPADVKAAPVVATTGPSTQPPLTPPPPEPRKRATSPLVWVGAAVGGVGLLVGAGVLSITKVQAAKDGCKDNLCPASTHDDLDTATTMATISNVGFLVAGAGAATALVGLIVGGKPVSPTAQRRGPAVTPWVGLGGVGLNGHF